MTVAKRPARPQLVVAAVGLVCVGIAGLALWLLAGVAGVNPSAISGDRQVRATVVRGAACQGADAFDSVRFTVAGQPHDAKVNGCGHQPGETVGVLVPPDLAADSVLDLSAAAPGDATGVVHRVAFVLLIIAAVVGGGGAYLTRRDLARARRRKKRPSGTHADRPGRAVPGARPDRLPADRDEAGVNWFEDSAGALPIDLGEHARKP